MGFYVFFSEKLMFRIRAGNGLCYNLLRLAIDVGHEVIRRFLINPNKVGSVVSFDDVRSRKSSGAKSNISERFHGKPQVDWRGASYHLS